MINPQESAPEPQTAFDPLQYASQIEAWAHAATQKGIELVPEGEAQTDPDGNTV